MVLPKLIIILQILAATFQPTTEELILVFVAQLAAHQNRQTQATLMVMLPQAAMLCMAMQVIATTFGQVILMVM